MVLVNGLIQIIIFLLKEWLKILELANKNIRVFMKDNGRIVLKFIII